MSFVIVKLLLWGFATSVFRHSQTCDSLNDHFSSQIDFHYVLNQSLTFCREILKEKPKKKRFDASLHAKSLSLVKCLQTIFFASSQITTHYDRKCRKLKMFDRLNRSMISCPVHLTFNFHDVFRCCCCCKLLFVCLFGALWLMGIVTSLISFRLFSAMLFTMCLAGSRIICSLNQLGKDILKWFFFPFLSEISYFMHMLIDYLSNVCLPCCLHILLAPCWRAFTFCKLYRFWGYCVFFISISNVPMGEEKKLRRMFLGRNDVCEYRRGKP